MPQRSVTPCSIGGCERPRSSGQGWCLLHYKRWRRCGDPRALQRGRPNRHEIGNEVSVLVMQRPDGTVQRSFYSAADHSLVAAKRWFVNAQGYVVTVEGPRGRRVHTRLARLLLSLDAADPRRPDHINGNRLDNRRSNLRIASHQANVAHQAIENRRGTSRYRNVYWSKRDRRWIARVKIDYAAHFIGSFPSEDAAGHAVAIFRAEHGLPSGY